MEYCYLMLDVGGTGIKAGLFSWEGRLIEPIRSWEAKAREQQEVIFQNFAHIITEMAGSRQIEGIGMAFPGPFDYEHGISQMKGLNKYDSIFGIPIRDRVMEKLKNHPGIEPDCRFLFLHDVEAFAMGACRSGEAKSCRKLLCVCIGTGAGSAFVEDSSVRKEAGGGVPENGWIYCTPYKDSVIDDYVSVRGLKRLTEAQLHVGEIDGIELFRRASSGDEAARRVFTMFGVDVEAALSPFLGSYRPDGLVLGGQIAKSFEYFGGQLRETCESAGVRIFLEPETSVRAMEGLCAAWRNMEETKEMGKGMEL